MKIIRLTLLPKNPVFLRKTVVRPHKQHTEEPNITDEEILASYNLDLNVDRIKFTRRCHLQMSIYRLSKLAIFKVTRII